MDEAKVERYERSNTNTTTRALANHGTIILLTHAFNSKKLLYLLPITIAQDPYGSDDNARPYLPSLYYLIYKYRIYNS
jgi:hypothetical protein